MWTVDGKQKINLERPYLVRSFKPLAKLIYHLLNYLICNLSLKVYLKQIHVLHMILRTKTNTEFLLKHSIAKDLNFLNALQNAQSADIL